MDKQTVYFLTYYNKINRKNETRKDHSLELSKKAREMIRENEYLRFEKWTMEIITIKQIILEIEE